MEKPIVSLLEQLRNHLVTQMHIGRLHPGDQLPSYRTLSDKWNVDHRLIARAYRALEAEGFVEVRGRSGVYLREQERIGGEMLSETAWWVASGVLTEALQRRIRTQELPKLIRKCIASTKIKALCIDSTEDHRYLLTRELREWFGFDATAIAIDDLPEPDTVSGMQVVSIDSLPEAVQSADVLITTTFHSHRVRPIAELLKKPIVPVSMHPLAGEILLDRLQAGPLTVVGVDPSFGERLRIIAGAEYQDRIHLVLANDKQSIEELDSDQPLLISPAAQEHVNRKFVSILNNVPSFSPESAAELAFLLIRLNLESVST